jgi:ADP-ribose pyrophosphatase
MGYVTLHSEIPFKGKVFSVRVDEVRKPNGDLMRVDVIEHHGAVILIPLSDREEILFVDQYRHPAGNRLLELPAGTINPGEDPEGCAIRECREEVGMSPGRLTKLGGFFMAPGYSTEFAHVYLAEALSPSPLGRDEDEDIRVRPIPLHAVEKLIEDGEVMDSKTLAGIFLAKQHRSKSNKQ